MDHKRQPAAFHVSALDALHDKIFSDIDRTSLSSDADFPALFAATIASIERDFAAEEDVMEELDFPALKGHREQHARLLASLHHAEYRVVMGDIAAGREAFMLLPQWLSVHISTSDAALGVALEISSLPDGGPG